MQTYELFMYRDSLIFWSIDELREIIFTNRLRWFGNVVVRRSDEVTVDGSIKGRGKSKLALGEVVQKDLDLLDTTEHDAELNEDNGFM